MVEEIAANALVTGAPNPHHLIGIVESNVAVYSGEPLLLGEAIEDLIWAACQVEKSSDAAARESLRRGWEANPWR